MSEEIFTIQCRACHGTAIPASQPWKQGEPVQFVYAPAGVHTITAGFRRHDVITVTLAVDEQTAKDLQQSFERLTATSKQEPYGDEDHESKKATLRFPKAVTQFTWGLINGEAGVVVAAEPTSYGAEAVNGKVYRSWSPEFATDCDYSKAVCVKCSKPAKACECDSCHLSFPDRERGSMSNPARIVGVNFIAGALTNKPAFQAMPPVKAKDASTGDTVQAAGTSEGVQKSWETRKKLGEEHWGLSMKHIDRALALREQQRSEKDPKKRIELESAANVHSAVGNAFAESARAHLTETKEAHERAQKAHSEAAFQAEKHGHNNAALKHSGLSRFHEMHAANMQATDATATETVQATGTSEGVKKSWEVRRQQSNAHFKAGTEATAKVDFKDLNSAVSQAWLASSRAHDLSAAAHLTGTADDHAQAQDAHYHASHLHRALGNTEQGDVHSNHGMEHGLKHYAMTHEITLPSVSDPSHPANRYAIDYQGFGAARGPGRGFDNPMTAKGHDATAHDAVQATWSDAARKAAAEAKKRNGLHGEKLTPGEMVMLHSPNKDEDPGTPFHVVEDRDDRVLVQHQHGFENWRIKPQSVFQKSDLMRYIKSTDATAADTVKANGNSEGCRKGWETRKSGLHPTQEAYAAAKAAHDLAASRVSTEKEMLPPYRRGMTDDERHARIAQEMAIEEKHGYWATHDHKREAEEAMIDAVRNHLVNTDEFKTKPTEQQQLARDAFDKGRKHPKFRDQLVDLTFKYNPNKQAQQHEPIRVLHELAASMAEDPDADVVLARLLESKPTDNAETVTAETILARLVGA